MAFAVFLKEYITWHYGQGIRDLIGVWHNFLWFGYYSFSIPVLAKTLFAPFYRIKEPYRGVDIQPLLESFVLNSISRLVGFILRSVVLIIGLSFEIIILATLIPALIFWIAFPAALAGIFIWGITLLL